MELSNIWFYSDCTIYTMIKYIIIYSPLLLCVISWYCGSWCKKALSPKEGHTAVQVLSSCRLDEMYLIDMNVIWH